MHARIPLAHTNGNTLARARSGAREDGGVSLIIPSHAHGVTNEESQTPGPGPDAHAHTWARALCHAPRTGMNSFSVRGVPAGSGGGGGEKPREGKKNKSQNVHR